MLIKYIIKIKLIKANNIFKFATVNVEKSWTSTQKCVRHYLKNTLLFKSFFIINRVLDLTTKIQEIHYLLLDSPWSITPSPTNPHKTRFKSDSEISYFFFDLFIFLKAKPIINRIIPKTNRLFPNWISGVFCWDWLGMGSKWWRFHLCLLGLLDLICKIQNSILL